MQLPFASLPVLEKLDSSLEGGTKVMIQHCLMGQSLRTVSVSGETFLETSKRMLQKVFDTWNVKAVGFMVSEAKVPGQAFGSYLWWHAKTLVLASKVLME